MRPLIRQLDHFAEALAETSGTAHDGNVVHVARKMRLADATGNGMLQRIRREVGWQAR